MRMFYIFVRFKLNSLEEMAWIFCWWLWVLWNSANESVLTDAHKIVSTTSIYPPQTSSRFGSKSVWGCLAREFHENRCREGRYSFCTKIKMLLRLHTRREIEWHLELKKRFGKFYAHHMRPSLFFQVRQYSMLCTKKWMGIKYCY